MNNKQKELKEKVEFYQASIKYFEERLNHLRDNDCLHEETELSNYMWATGHITGNVETCSICGKVIKFPVPSFDVVST